MVEGVEVLAVVEVPQHRLGVLAARRAQRTVGRHRHLIQSNKSELGVELGKRIGN